MACSTSSQHPIDLYVDYTIDDFFSKVMNLVCVVNMRPERRYAFHQRRDELVGWVYVDSPQ
jgi:hypothetical protein